MSANTGGRRSVWCPIRISAVLVVVAVAVIAFAREPLLRAVGWALFFDEPVARADVIVVPSGSGEAGVLEAADLVQSGVAGRVAVFTDPPRRVDREFIRRGVPYEDVAARQTRQLKSLGVTDVVPIPVPTLGTRDESAILSSWCDEHGIRSAVVVVTKDHARRLRRVLDRAAEGRTIRFSVRSAHYSGFDPDQWWRTRTGMRTGIIEFQKLVLDLLRHPVPF